MFNQSILHPEGAAIGRLSLKRNPGDLQTDESSLDFDTVSQSTAASDKSNQLRADMRSSSCAGRKTGVANVKLEDFEIKMQLGQGTFGRVYLAELPGTDRKFAIKAIRKDVLIEYDQIKSTALEKDILFEADHPFLCGMEYLFQSEARLYFVMPFINGGELYKIFQEQKRFPEDTVKFYAA